MIPKALTNTQRVTELKSNVSRAYTNAQFFKTTQLRLKYTQSIVMMNDYQIVYIMICIYIYII